MWLAFPILTALLGLVLAYLGWRAVRSAPREDLRAWEMAQAIEQGARVFMRAQWQRLAAFGLSLALLIALSPLGIAPALAFLLGAFSSALAGWIGMQTATRANLHTALAAKRLEAHAAFGIAFQGGAVMGITVAAIGLLGISLLIGLLGTERTDWTALHAYGLGASLVALFARVGGGIFTKAADVGADLVGKIEAGIPEDDPRNPAVIADNVGDNVGDIAGMGSDLYESYCGAMIAAMAIAVSVAMTGAIYPADNMQHVLLLPLLLCTVGLIAAMMGVLALPALRQLPPDRGLLWMSVGVSLLFVLGTGGMIAYLGLDLVLWWCVLAGILGGVVIGFIADRYTRGPAIQALARMGETGPATIVIGGLSLGMRTIAVPVITLAIIILLTSHWAGLYGVSLAAVGMLGTVGWIMAMDAYGAIADNAGGIVELSGMGEAARTITDTLDALGNTTAAIGKGFAIGAAALAALALLTAVWQILHQQSPELVLSLNEPRVLAGLLIGALFPFWLSAILLTAVGDAANTIIVEVRRQFAEIPGLLDGTAPPETEHCVAIASQAALNRMRLPGVMAVLAPIVVGFGLGPQALAGLLAGALICCVVMALLMANAGGAWDNAKKYVEQGHLGGKGSRVHQATVVGDTIGDPLKDTAGPSLNILIKLMAFVSLMIAPLLV